MSDAQFLACDVQDYPGAFLFAERGCAQAEVVGGGIPPVASGEVIEVGGALAVCIFYQISGLPLGTLSGAAHTPDAVFCVSRQEYIQDAVAVAQYVAGASADENAVLTGVNVTDGIALKFEHRFVAHVVMGQTAFSEMCKEK